MDFFKFKKQLSEWVGERRPASLRVLLQIWCQTEKPVADRIDYSFLVTLWDEILDKRV